jgi:Tol biopolymer transport system component
VVESETSALAERFLSESGDGLAEFGQSARSRWRVHADSINDNMFTSRRPILTRRQFLAPALFLVATLLPAQSKLLRQPSYSKGRIAFSYLGDIWIANEDGAGLTRLTDSVAREVFPRFSPDGNWIAFSSNRAGNFDVYVVAASGGKPLCIVNTSSLNQINNFAANSKTLNRRLTTGLL